MFLLLDSSFNTFNRGVKQVFCLHPLVKDFQKGDSHFFLVCSNVLSYVIRDALLSETFSNCGKPMVFSV